MVKKFLFCSFLWSLFFSIGASPITVQTGSFVDGKIVADGGSFSIDSTVLKSKLIDGLLENISGNFSAVKSGERIPVAISQNVFGYLYDLQRVQDRLMADEMLSQIASEHVLELIGAAHYLGMVFNRESADALLHTFVARFGAVVLYNKSMLLQLVEVIGREAIDALCKQVTRYCWEKVCRHPIPQSSESPSAIDCSPDSRFLIYGNVTGELFFVDLINHRSRRVEVDGDITSLHFSPDGNSFLATCTRRTDGTTIGTIYVFDLELNRMHRTFVANGLFGAVFSPDGTNILVYPIYDQQNNRDIAYLLRSSTLVTQTSFYCSEFISAAIFSLDGRTLYVGTPSGSIQLFDVATTTPVDRWNGHHGYINTLALSSDGSILASGSGEIEEGDNDCSVSMWNVHNGQRIHRMQFGSDVLNLRFLNFGVLFCGTLFGGAYFCDNGVIKHHIPNLEDVCGSAEMVQHGNTYVIAVEAIGLTRFLPLSLRYLALDQILFICRVALLEGSLTYEDIRELFPIYQSLPTNVQSFVLSIAPQFAEV